MRPGTDDGTRSRIVGAEPVHAAQIPRKAQRSGYHDRMTIFNIILALETFICLIVAWLPARFTQLQEFCHSMFQHAYCIWRIVSDHNIIFPILGCQADARNATIYAFPAARSASRLWRW